MELKNNKNKIVQAEQTEDGNLNLSPRTGGAMSGAQYKSPCLTVSVN